MEDERYSQLYLGTVADRDDPESLGRVRLLVPGIYDAPSPWALPIGTVGGGSKERGFWAVPEKDADVAVLFLMGDPERPCYMGGHWGKPGGASEVPSYVGGLSKTDAGNVRAFETAKFLMVFDDRSSAKLILKDKTHNKLIQISDDKVLLGANDASEPFVLGSMWKTCMEAILDAIISHTHPSAVGPTGGPVNASAFTTEKTGLSTKLSAIVQGK